MGTVRIAFESAFSDLQVHLCRGERVARNCKRGNLYSSLSFSRIVRDRRGSRRYTLRLSVGEQNSFRCVGPYASVRHNKTYVSDIRLSPLRGLCRDQPDCDGSVYRTRESTPSHEATGVWHIEIICAVLLLIKYYFNKK